MRRRKLITLPLHKGLTASGATTWYVVKRLVNQADRASLAVNYAPRLANALGTNAAENDDAPGRRVSSSRHGPTSRRSGSSFPRRPGFPPTKVLPARWVTERQAPGDNRGQTVLDRRKCPTRRPEATGDHLDIGTTRSR